MAEKTWELSGEYMESCNCDYLCPCIYTNPQGEVTHDHCTAALIFRIDQGQHGATDLSGLCFALLIRFAVACRGEVMRRAGPLLYPFFFLMIAYALAVGNAGTGFRYRTHRVTLALGVTVLLRQGFLERRTNESPMPSAARVPAGVSLTGQFT